jgi:hypothetical protein
MLGQKQRTKRVEAPSGKYLLIQKCYKCKKSIHRKGLYCFVCKKDFHERCYKKSKCNHGAFSYQKGKYLNDRKFIQNDDSRMMPKMNRETIKSIKEHARIIMMRNFKKFIKRYKIDTLFYIFVVLVFIYAVCN